MAVPSPHLPETTDSNLIRRLSRYLAERSPRIVAEWETHPAAVLVPLYQDRGTWNVLYTRRTHSVVSHPGQVAFPGGRMEADDRGPEQTAKRETEEEIGVRPGDVSVVGVLDTVLTVSQHLVSPVVATVPWPYPLTLSEIEVAAVFGVPLPWLADPAHLEARPRQAPNAGQNPVVYYFQPYAGEVIWGVTARITLQLLEALRGSAAEETLSWIPPLR